MIEFNEMHSSSKDQTSLVYKILKIFLMFLSGIIMFYYLVGIVSYVTSGPSATLFDDLTTEFVIQVILMGLGLFYLIVAWFRQISYSIVSIVFTVLYVIYTSLLSGGLVVSFLPIAMVLDAVGFIILGTAKKLRKRREYDVYASPVADEYEGPDIFNFRI